MAGEDPERYAVLGHPVAHSLSPRMQNAAFRAAGRNAEYVAIDVAPGRLPEELARLHEAGFRGLNVTLPWKEEALRLARASTLTAQAAGAANTLRRVTGGWDADATDGRGFLTWLTTLGIRATGARALVLGAGGAARSVAAALAQRGAATVRIVNRTEARAIAAAETARGAAEQGTRVEAAAWNAAPPERSSTSASTERFDFLVRALAVESVSEEERRWWKTLSPEGRVLDLNYGQRARAAKEEASGMGMGYEDGLTLLVEQGALSYEFWTGERAPREAMRESLRDVG